MKKFGSKDFVINIRFTITVLVLTLSDGFGLHIKKALVFLTSFLGLFYE